MFTMSTSNQHMTANDHMTASPVPHDLPIGAFGTTLLWEEDR